ncbi:MAG: ABC transporter substrate-binding protein [Candidatus Thorarchaeota archaeon]
MRRDRFLLGLAVVVLLLAGLTWERTSALTASISNIEQTIILGTSESVKASIDPAQSYDLFGWMIISSLSSGLVEIVPGSDAGSEGIRGALASSWTANVGGTIWDFTLREGLTFFDGYAFNATVVKYSFDRNIGMALPDGPQFNIGYADIIENVTITGEYSVRFYLKSPFAPFLQLMACPASAIVHPLYAPLGNFVSHTDGNARASHPCGLGPFILKEWVRVGGTDELMCLERNPHYWNNSIPMSDITIKFYFTQTSLAAALMTGDIDVAYKHLTPIQVQSFRDSPDFEVVEELSPQIQFLCFQQNTYPFNETRIRQGIAAALNRSRLAEVVFVDTVHPLHSIIPRGLAYHKPTFQIYGDANYTYTRACLDDFGYNVTNKIQIDLYYETSGYYPLSAEQAVVYMSDLEASGVIDVSLYGLDWPTYKLNRNEGSMPVFIYGWYPEFFDADDFAFLPFAQWLNLGYNSTYPQGGIDQYNLWLDGRSTTTDIERQAAYNSLQDLQAEECSIVPLWQGHQVAASASEVSGILLDITESPHLSLLDVELASTTTSTTTTSSTTTSLPSTTSTPTSTISEGLDPYVLIFGIGISGVLVIIIVFVLIKRRP